MSWKLEDGRVKHASIITPTVHNLGDTESSVRTLADLLAEQGASEEEIRLRSENSFVRTIHASHVPCIRRFLRVLRIENVSSAGFTIIRAAFGRFEWFNVDKM